MKYTSINLLADVEMTDVFNALHQYKKEKNPYQLFGDVLPCWLVKVKFKIVSDNDLGLGATYHWQFKLLGMNVLEFTEQIVEWEKNKTVAYKAIAGWDMFFRVELSDVSYGTCIKMEIDFSPFKILLLDKIFAPFVRWRLQRVSKRLKQNILKNKEVDFKQSQKEVNYESH